jgi:peptidoglycan/LPS O-acetylase OafA/YrhL
MAAQTRNFRNLDLLRTIAVLCVFVNHVVYMLIPAPHDKTLLPVSDGSA